MDSKLTAKQIMEKYIDKNAIPREIKDLADKVLGKILNPTHLYTTPPFAKLKSQLRASEDNLKSLETERRELEIFMDILNARKLDLAKQTVEETAKREALLKRIEERRREQEMARKAEEERAAREAADKEERRLLRLAQLESLEKEKQARINAPALDSTPQIAPFLAPTSASNQPASSLEESASEIAVPSSTSLATATSQRRRTQRQQRMGQSEEGAILQAAVEHFRKTNNIWSKDLKIPGISRPWTSLRKKAIRLVQHTSKMRLQHLGLSERQALIIKNKFKDVKT